MAQACHLHDFDDTGNDALFVASGLLAATAALMLLALSTVHLNASSSGLFTGAQPPIIDRVMEWRPQGPPPAFDVDQLTPEDVEQPAPATVSAGSVEMTGRDSGNLRARPER